MQVHPDLLRLDDVLPLSRDLELDQARSGALDNPQAAGAWPDSDAAARKLEEWGRTGGFQATFIRRRPGTPDNPIVQAWADVSTYRTSKGALDALNDLAARLMKQGATTITGASIGDGSVTLRQVNGNLATLHVLFRDGSAGVWIAVTGEAAGLQQEPVERLANVLSERIG